LLLMTSSLKLYSMWLHIKLVSLIEKGARFEIAFFDRSNAFWEHPTCTFFI
jgi:hypothetical protein